MPLQPPFRSLANLGILLFWMSMETCTAVAASRTTAATVATATAAAVSAAATCTTAASASTRGYTEETGVRPDDVVLGLAPDEARAALALRSFHPTLLLFATLRSALPRSRLRASALRQQRPQHTLLSVRLGDASLSSVEAADDTDGCAGGGDVAAGGGRR